MSYILSHSLTTELDDRILVAFSRLTYGGQLQIQDELNQKDLTQHLKHAPWFLR